ncbi:hypothetical protein [Thalassospira sp. SM2505]
MMLFALIAMIITRLIQRSVMVFAPDGEQATGSDPPAGHSRRHGAPYWAVNVWHQCRGKSVAESGHPHETTRRALLITETPSSI